jgi:hypothetical protein
MVNNVLICGAGQIGSRYLQGLANCSTPMRIYLQDLSAQALDRAIERWEGTTHGRAVHHVITSTKMDDLPRKIDIAIVATTADVRPFVVEAVSKRSEVFYWLLEKVLAQSEEDLRCLENSISKSRGAWVNTSRRMMRWYRDIASHLDLSEKKKLEVCGGDWGLACNGIHFLDLAMWWTGEQLVFINTDDVDPIWFKSKRPGFWDIHGTIEAIYSSGTTVSLTSQDSDHPFSVRVIDGSHSWLIEEASGIARRDDGLSINGRVTYQSEMTHELVKSLITAGECNLPSFKESVELHSVFVTALLNHWNRNMDTTAKTVPIT